MESNAKIKLAVAACLITTGCVTERKSKMASYVIDRIENASRYYSCNALFEKAFEFVRTHNLVSLPTGRYEIVGEDCYAVVQESELTRVSLGHYEVHKTYVDIQIPIDGEELFGLVETPDIVLAGAKWTLDDCQLFDAPIEPVKVKPGEFIILFPLKGAHAPCLTDGEPRKIRKLVIKVKAGQ